jgi:YggT family protein
MPVVVLNFLQLLFSVLMLLVIARVIVSWLAPSGGGGLVAFIYQATEPILAPIRRVVPPSGGLDWAPLIAMLVLGLLLRLVVQMS